MEGYREGCHTPPPSLEYRKKSVQNSVKIVKKVDPISRSRDVCFVHVNILFGFWRDKNKIYIRANRLFSSTVVTLLVQTEAYTHL